MAPQPENKVLVVDDHALIRLGLARAFERAPEFTVVGQAANVAEALHFVTQDPPGVVVTDVRLPDGSGLDLLRALRERYPSMGLVVVTMYARDEYLFQALEAGASAFVSKDAPAEQVVNAARQALVSPLTFTASNLVEAMQRKRSREEVTLSPRECEILELLAEGLGATGIARQLFVSESTAKTHIAKIYEKLGAANRAQAIMAAVRAGLLASD